MIPDLGLLTKIQIVLVSPEYAGNVGSVARAMKTMGFTRLVLVRPKRYLFLEPDAVWMSSCASDLLYRTQVFTSLEEAVAESQWVIGTSVRPRAIGEPLCNVRVSAPKLCAQLQEGIAISLVFGSEPKGLSNADLQLCHQVWTIPTSKEYTSLNLAQAVQVVLYELRQTLLAATEVPPLAIKQCALAKVQELEGFFQHLEQVAIQSGYLDPKKPRHLMEHMRALFKRTTLTRSEIDMLRGMFSAWEKKLREL